VFAPDGPGGSGLWEGGSNQMKPKDFCGPSISFMKDMYDHTMDTWGVLFEYGEKMLEFAAGQGGADNDEFKKFYAWT